MTGIYIVICKGLQQRSRVCKRKILPLPNFECMKVQNHLGHRWTRISKCRRAEINGSLYLGRKHFHYNLFQQKNSEFRGVYLLLGGLSQLNLYYFSWLFFGVLYFCKSIGMDLH